MYSLSRVTVSLAFLLAFCLPSAGQGLRVGFYNVENLFDTINDMNVADGDFTPQGRHEWDYSKFSAKLAALSGGISLFDPDLLGLCEVENYGVVDSLSRRTARLRGIVHYNSKDSRGIDLALIYDTARVHVLSSEPIFVGSMRRNFLKVEVVVDGSRNLTLFVVHLPSQLGGSGAADRRDQAIAALDSLTRGLNNAIVMGDFNNSPRAVGALHNCAIEPFERGEGSYAYRDAWDMIDQIVISRQLLPFTDGVQRVVRDKSLLQHSGRYMGYPIKRKTSDHLPVFIVMH